MENLDGRKRKNIEDKKICKNRTSKFRNLVQTRSFVKKSATKFKNGPKTRYEI